MVQDVIHTTWLVPKEKGEIVGEWLREQEFELECYVHNPRYETLKLSKQEEKLRLQLR